MLVLGIESSCDETAASIVNSNKKILSNIVSSQINQHQEYGGVVPEVAARSHLTNIIPIIKETLKIANIKIYDISAIASVIGPGLYGGLLVGCTTAKALALCLSKPFIAINHLEAHILTPRLLYNIPFPYLALLISGGHTQFIAVKGINKYKILGNTLDDALGEAFDKTARLLGYPYPGGKYIEQIAKKGISGVFKFKPPLLYSKNCNFSFSGLKTSVRLKIDVLKESGKLSEQNKANIALAFEEAILTVLRKKTIIAIQKFKKEYGEFNNFIVSGGVAANYSIRNTLQQVVLENKANFYAPEINLCGDNAAMVAWVGIEKLQLSIVNPLTTLVKPNLEL